MFTGRQLARQTILLMVGMLFAPLLAACVTSAPQAAQHRIYNYKQFLGPLNATTPIGENYFLLQTENKIVVRWQPFPDGEATQINPTLVKLEVYFIGPFPSVESLHQAMKPDSKADGPVVTSSPSIQTDEWTNKTYESVLVLPEQLKPGFYQLLQEVCENGNGSNGCFPGWSIIKI